MGFLTGILRVFTGSAPIVIVLDPAQHTWQVLPAIKNGKDWHYGKAAVEPAQVWHREVFFGIADKRMVLVSDGKGPLGVINDQAQVVPFSPEKYAAAIKTRKVVEYLTGESDWKILVIIALAVVTVVMGVANVVG